MKSWRDPMAAVLALGLMSVHAQTLDIDFELNQVKAQRAAVEADFDALLRDCYQRLNVNDCRAQVQIERSQALQPIKHRLRQLTEQQRQIKADQRREKIQSRGTLD